jgi:nucleoid DNA-binding protein
MDKIPNNTTVKDFFTAKVAKELEIPSSLVEKVIDFQCEDLSSAFSEFNTIEISGFGRFTYNNSRSLKKLKTYEKQLQNVLNRLNENKYKSENEKIWDGKRAIIYQGAINKIKNKNSLL